MSRTGFVIMYAGCPILWSSKLQSQIALSTTEAEYIALSQAVREVIPLMRLIQELKGLFFVNKKNPEFFCEVFEDNRSTIAAQSQLLNRKSTRHEQNILH